MQMRPDVREPRHRRQIHRPRFIAPKGSGMPHENEMQADRQ